LMRVTSGKSRVREIRLPGSVRAKPNGRATRPRSLASIGGEFVEEFAARAMRNNLSPGMLVALTVKAFANQASFHQRDEVWRLAHGTDQPILSGLRHILAQSAIFESAAP
jgi:hypothetical protein